MDQWASIIYPSKNFQSAVSRHVIYHKHGAATSKHKHNMFKSMNTFNTVKQDDKITVLSRITAGAFISFKHLFTLAFKRDRRLLIYDELTSKVDGSTLQ